MSRLIDADALMELVEKTHCTGCNSYNKVRCRACPTGDMLDYLDDAPTVNEWHYPSKGEYPTETDEYLLFYEAKNDTSMAVGMFYAGAKEWYCEDILPPMTVPIAWMHLPKPPKEEA